MNQERLITSFLVDLKHKKVLGFTDEHEVIRMQLTDIGVILEIIDASPIARPTVESEEAKNPQPEQGEKDPVSIYTGKIKGYVRAGRPDGSGKPTAWARVAVHEDGVEEAKMLSTSFHRHTADIALRLQPDSQITMQGYLHKNDDPEKMDSFRVFHLIDYPGKPAKE